MRRLHQAIGAVETYSPAEERFNRRRRTAGLFLAPATLLLVLLLPMPGLPDAGHRLAAVMAAVVVLWVSEALPMAVTALLGPALAVVFQVATARRALASFADPIIFLFIGSFVLAEAMFVHGLDRRIAFTTLSSRLVGSSAVRMLVAYGGVATLVSMWISNTATTAMLFPIGLSIVGHVGLRGTASPDAVRRFAISMMLVTSFAASVGGMATPVGTPPNLIGLGFISRLGGEPVSFLAWTRLGVPLVLVMTALLLGWFAWWGARGLRIEAEGLALVREERDRLGPWTRGQRNVVVAFAVAVFLWVAPGLAAIVGQDGSRAMQAFATSVPEAIAALIGAVLLFLLPIDWRQRRFTLTWDQAAGIDWGIILLYGGGLALGDLAFDDRLRRGRHRAVGGDLERRLGQHDRAGGDRGRAGVRHRAAAAGAGRHARREHGVHDADLDGAERDRLQLRLRADRRDDAPRPAARSGQLRRDRGRGHAAGTVGRALTPVSAAAGRR
jgi:sodium-dependent dicarboxylate transporter 2/3/5